jgi:hypothetical protein
MSGVWKPTREQWRQFCQLAHEMLAVVTLQYDGELLEEYVVADVGSDFALIAQLNVGGSVRVIAYDGIELGVMVAHERAKDEDRPVPDVIRVVKVSSASLKEVRDGDQPGDEAGRER